jgi:hypothetical protein
MASVGTRHGWHEPRGNARVLAVARPGRAAISVRRAGPATTSLFCLQAAARRQPPMSRCPAARDQLSCVKYPSLQGMCVSRTCPSGLRT